MQTTDSYNVEAFISILLKKALFVGKFGFSVSVYTFCIPIVKAGRGTLHRRKVKGRPNQNVNSLSTQVANAFIFLINQQKKIPCVSLLGERNTNVLI